MTLFTSSAPPLPHIPENLSIPQFIFDFFDPSIRPPRPLDAPWLVEDDSGRSYGELELRKRTDALANSLYLRYNIRQDDVVLIFSRNHIDWPVVVWATHRIGGIISGANPEFSASELADQLEVTRAKIIIISNDATATATHAINKISFPVSILVFDTDTSTFPAIDSLIADGSKLGRSAFTEPPINAKTKLAFLSFSSGTTGKPKAVAIPHYAVIANVFQIVVSQKINSPYTEWENRRFRPGDVTLGLLPFYHIYGLVPLLYTSLFIGMTVFNFVNMLKSIIRHRVTDLKIVPPQAILLCKHPEVKNYDLSGIRTIGSAAAPLSKEIIDQLCQILPKAQIGQGYGMTETCTAVSMFPVSQKIGTRGSAGHLLSGITAKIIKEDGSWAKAGEPGELVTKSPSNALGYTNNEQATNDTFIDGWVMTGDLAMIDSEGELWILDRIKEVLKVRGFQVAPAELEGCILDHPDVRDVCVVGLADEYSGEVPLAFVSLSADAKERISREHSEKGVRDSIIKHVADRKAKYKHLAGGVAFIDEIPKTPSGKLLRKDLRAKAKTFPRRAMKTKL